MKGLFLRRLVFLSTAAFSACPGFLPKEAWSGSEKSSAAPFSRESALSLLNRLEISLKEKIAEQDYSRLPLKEWKALQTQWPGLSKKHPDLIPKKNEVEKLLNLALSLKENEKSFPAGKSLRVDPSEPMQNAVQGILKSPGESGLRQFYDAARPGADSGAVQGRRSVRAGAVTSLPGKGMPPVRAASPPPVSHPEPKSEPSFWKRLSGFFKPIVRAFAVIGRVPERVFSWYKEDFKRSFGIGYERSKSLPGVWLKGSREERKELEGIISRMLESPTARALAERIRKEKIKADISFEKFANSKLYEEKGKKYFTGTSGRFYVGGLLRRDNVILNKNYLGTGDKDDAAVTLAHELLGHCVDGKSFKRAGLREAYGIYRGNETNARLVQWSVKTELKGKIKDPDMSDFLASPEKYYAKLQLIDYGYARELGLSESQDPVTAYQQRVKRVDEKMKKDRERKRDLVEMQKAMGHFVDAHRMRRDSFREVSEEVENCLSFYPDDISDLKEIKRSLSKSVSVLGSPKGRQKIQKLQKDFSHPMFQDSERKIQDLTSRLRRTLRNAPPARDEPDSRPAKGQITWEKLERMIREDKVKNPGHWSSKP